MKLYGPVYVPRSKYGFKRRCGFSLERRQQNADPCVPHNSLLLISLWIFRVALGW